jgi:hypothetical protein
MHATKASFEQLRETMHPMHSALTVGACFLALLPTSHSLATHCSSRNACSSAIESSELEDAAIDSGDYGLTSLHPGDFNQDGRLDLLDLDILGRNFGKPGTHSDGDANNDGLVNLLDLDVLSDPNFGVPATTAVPEPTGALMLAACVVAATLRRRSHQ